MNLLKTIAFAVLLLSLNTFTQAQSKLALKNNWFISSATSLKVAGKELSSTNFKNTNWHKAQVPSTVMKNLVDDGTYKDLYVGKNLESVDTKQFQKAWWYRTNFKIEDVKQHARLEVLGINYKANIWLNGVLIADSSQVNNTFRQFYFDITSKLKKGDNALAIEVFPPKAGDFSIGFVDWNPTPPDNNMGVFRPVNIVFDGGVSINEPFVQSKLDVVTLQKADLTISSILENSSSQAVTGQLKGKIGTIEFTKDITLAGLEKKKIVLTEKDFPALSITNPRIWWPHTIGEPNMYQLQMSFVVNTKETDKTIVDFGIRDVTTYRTPEGYQGYKVNGKPFQIRGGGWVDDLLLGDTPEYITSQLEYTKDMNLNTVRLEGFWGKDETMYSLCDKMGLLVMVGWTCHWEWEDYLGTKCDEKFGGILKEKDIDLMSKAWKDQIVWLRNHPSIFVWMSGSDCVPKPELEQNYFNIFNEYDSTRAYLASAKEWISLAGYTGVKMRGPYDYEPPVYWYTDKLFGGAFGFNTETGPGAQVPPLESMKKMLPADKLWPINDTWEYHAGRHSFGKLDLFTKSLEARYGKMNSVEEYTFIGQALNYELMRPMFEAFLVNKNSNATGIIQWMLNSAWPEVYWQLYDTYLMPNGAYYGTKKACAPLQLIYNYGDKAIYLNNDHLKDFKDLKATLRMYDVNSNKLFEQVVNLSIAANTVNKILDLPEVNPANGVYFVDLKLSNIAGYDDEHNFYWLSNKADVLDYEAKVPGWYFHTPAKEYADFSAVRNIAKTKITSTLKKNDIGLFDEFEVEITNVGKDIALWVNPSIIDQTSGLSILPVRWEDNYFSILPGEKRTVRAVVSKKDSKGKMPVLKIEALNIQ